MKKQLILTCVIVLFICVGLSGCQTQNCPNPNENKPIYIGCILQNPDRYLNKTVIIRGVFSKQNDSFWIQTPSIFYANVPDLFDIDITNLVNKSILIAQREYYFTGVVKKFESGKTGLHPFYLEVIKIQEI